MSFGNNFSTVKRDDEIWTEEEVMEFGLAGEEEFCDMQLIETEVPFVAEETTVVDDEDDVSVTETSNFDDDDEEEGSPSFVDAPCFTGELDVYDEMPNVEETETVFTDATTTKSGRVSEKLF